MKPIIFSTPMVQAILEGCKTQTRRVVKPQPPKLENIPLRPIIENNEVQFWGIGTTQISGARCPYRHGDILWVRETWRVRNVYGDFARHDRTIEIEYKAGGDTVFMPVTKEVVSWNCWRPSIHMPRTAARIFLRVTDVRVERVQEISEEDALREGIVEHLPGRFHYLMENAPGNYMGTYANTAKQAFMWLWNEINTKRGYIWASNPWVWVYTFERITREVADL